MRAIERERVQGSYLTFSLSIFLDGHVGCFHILAIREKGTLYTVGRNVNCSNHIKNTMGVLQKIKNRSTIDPAIPLLGIYPKEVKSVSYKYICAPTVHFRIIHNSQHKTHFFHLEH